MDKSLFNDDGLQVLFPCANCGEIVWQLDNPEEDYLPIALSIHHFCQQGSVVQC